MPQYCQVFPEGRTPDLVAVPPIGLLMELNCRVQRGISASYFVFCLIAWKETNSQNRFPRAGIVDRATPRMLTCLELSMQTVEPVYAMLKRVMGFTRFHLRGARG